MSKSKLIKLIVTSVAGFLISCNTTNNSGLEQAINESAFKWVDNFIVTDPSGYHEAYLEGLRKGEEILNQVLDKVRR